MVVHIGKVNLGLVAHVSFDFHGGVVSLRKRGYAVHIVSSKTVDKGLDGLESTFVEDQVTLKNMDCRGKGRTFEPWRSWIPRMNNLRRRTLVMVGLIKTLCSSERILL